MSDGNTPRDSFQRSLVAAQRLIAAMVPRDFDLTQRLARMTVEDPAGATTVTMLATFAALLLEGVATAEEREPEDVLARLGSAIARRNEAEE